MKIDELSVKAKFKKAAPALLLLVILAGCAAPAKVKSVEPGDAAAMAKTAIVKPGDIVDVNYTCRLKTGDVVAATRAVAETDSKSNIFVARKGDQSVAIAAVKPEEPLPERLGPQGFETEIQERLMRNVTGMKEGEKRRMELTAEMIQPKDEQSGFGRLSRVRTRHKEMKMSKGDYESLTGKAPEVGQYFANDPAFPGRVESVADGKVVIRFYAKPGSVIETPFGPGLIREEGENYKVDIDAREGKLVRTGNNIGRIISVTDRVITVDYRHPFGYEALVCEVTADKIREAETKKEEVKSEYEKRPEDGMKERGAEDKKEEEK